MKYRYEIDGLRALAVFFVIFYHYQITSFNDYFSGGYLGVDIFFVISGYLITGFVYEKIFISKNFKLLEFYEKRIRRIYPVLLVFLLISFFTNLFLSPFQLHIFNEGMISSLFSHSNIYFLGNSNNYFSEDTAFNPFAHTWSLGIEVQFYLLFPLILLLFKRLGFEFLILVLFLSSLIFFVYFLDDHNFNFYFPFSRIWEFLLGSFAFYFYYHKFYEKLNIGSIKKIIAFLSIVLIFLSFFLAPAFIHPGIITFLLCFSTFIFLISINSSNVLLYIFSSRLMKGIGLISYSLYIWHYPILVFYRKYNGSLEIDQYLAFIFLFITILVSIISYYFLEKPFRNKSLFSSKSFFTVVIIFILIIFNLRFLSPYNFSYFDFYFKNITYVNKILDANIWNDAKDQDKQACYNRKDNFCKFVDDNFNNKISNHISVIGDSHIATLQKNLIDQLGKLYDISIMTNSGCPYIIGGDLFKDNNSLLIDENCKNELQVTRSKYIDSLVVDKSIVIYGGRFQALFNENYFDNKEGGLERGGSFWRKYKSIEEKSNLSKDIKNTINRLIDGGHKVLLIYPIPESGWIAPYKFYNETLIKKSNSPITSSYNVFIDRTREVYETFNSIVHENIIRVYPEKVFCNTIKTGRCVISIDQKLLYSDTTHLSSDGAEMLTDEIVRVIKEMN